MSTIYKLVMLTVHLKFMYEEFTINICIKINVSFILVYETFIKILDLKHLVYLVLKVGLEPTIRNRQGIFLLLLVIYS